MDILDDMGVSYQQKFFFKVNYSFNHSVQPWQQSRYLLLIAMVLSHACKQFVHHIESDTESSSDNISCVMQQCISIDYYKTCLH